MVIPTIDPEKFSKDEIAQTIYNSLHEFGFALLKSPIDEDFRKEIMRLTKAFFDLPIKAKMEIKRSDSQTGYETMFEEVSNDYSKPDFKESIYLSPTGTGWTGSRMGVTLWPNEEENPSIKGFKEVMQKYMALLQKTTKDMLSMLALGLKLRPDYFDDFLDSEVALLRLHHYPPATTEIIEDNQFGIAAHTDFGLLTILLQDEVGGLERYDRRTEKWVKIPADPSLLVLNSGDMIQILTNDKTRPVMHRVTVNTHHTDRYSLAWFNEANLSKVLECIPELLEAGEEPKFKPTTVKEYLLLKYGENYGASA